METARPQNPTGTSGGSGMKNLGALMGSLLAWQSGSKEDMASSTLKYSAALNRYVCNVIIGKIHDQKNIIQQRYFFKTVKSMLDVEYLVLLNVHSYS